MREALFEGPGLIPTSRKHSRESSLCFGSLSSIVTAVFPRGPISNQPNEFMISTNMALMSVWKDAVFAAQSGFF